GRARDEDVAGDNDLAVGLDRDGERPLVRPGVEEHLPVAVEGRVQRAVRVVAVDGQVTDRLGRGERPGDNDLTVGLDGHRVAGLLREDVREQALGGLAVAAESGVEGASPRDGAVFEGVETQRCASGASQHWCVPDVFGREGRASRATVLCGRRGAEWPPRRSSARQFEYTVAKLATLKKSFADSVMNPSSFPTLAVLASTKPPVAVNPLSNPAGLYRVMKSPV